MKDFVTELLETLFTPKDLITELLETLFTPTDDDMEKWKETHSSFAKMNEEEKAFAITVVSSEAFQQEITEGLKLVRDGLNAILEMPAPEKNRCL